MQYRVLVSGGRLCGRSQNGASQVFMLMPCVQSFSQWSEARWQELRWCNPGVHVSAVCTVLVSGGRLGGRCRDGASQVFTLVPCVQSFSQWGEA